MASLEGLRQRLGALVQQRGGAEAPVADPQSWATRIAGLRDAQRVRESMRRGAERALPGEDVARGVRLVRSVEPWPVTGGVAQGGAARHAAVGAAHGGAVAEPDVAYGDPCGDSRTAPPWETPGARAGPLVFLDTETTGLSGGTGTLVFLLGLARFEGPGLLVEQWLLTRPSDESGWLDAISGSLPRDAHLVSFNGKAFDLPLLATRYALGRRCSPFAQRPHWDLLFPLRRAFDTRWPDCRLQTAERRLLGIERCDDLPGAFAPAAYQAFLRGVEPGLMPRVLAHNRQDLVSLAHLIPALARVYRDPLAFDADAGAIGRNLARKGRAAEAEAVLEPSAARQTGARAALAEVLRRQKRWDEAEAHWTLLARQGCPRACESMAKLAEHVRRSPESALEWALTLENREPDVARHARRIVRLRRKLEFRAPKTVNRG